MDDTVKQAIDAACANNGALLHWAFHALLGTSVAASVVANFRKYLTPAQAKAADVIALNLVKAAADHAAQQGVQK